MHSTSFEKFFHSILCRTNRKTRTKVKRDEARENPKFVSSIRHQLDTIDEGSEEAGTYRPNAIEEGYAGGDFGYIVSKDVKSHRQCTPYLVPRQRKVISFIPLYVDRSGLARDFGAHTMRTGNMEAYGISSTPLSFFAYFSFPADFTRKMIRIKIKDETILHRIKLL